MLLTSQVLLVHQSTRQSAVMLRDPNESQQPQSRYESLAGKAKEQWADKKVTDLYQDANKNANATAESAKSKAKENAKAKSSG